MDIVDRLIKFRDHIGYTNSQFADMAGIPRPTLSQFLNGRNKRLSDDLTSRLHTAFPSLNVMWLLFGEGNMLTNENFEISETQKGLLEPSSQSETTATEEIEQSAVVGSSFNEKRQSTVFASDIAPEFANSNNSTGNSATIVNLASANASKQIESIMVFYTDKSFDIFKPSGK